MHIVGHGIDMVDIDAFALIVETDSSDFLARCFTGMEIELSSDYACRHQFLAGRYAAKEAVSKSLETGFTEVVSPRCIEIARTKTGAPRVILHGPTAQFARSLGVTHWKLSISHSNKLAISSALALGRW